MGGTNTRPTALSFNYRVSNYIKEKLLEDKNFDIFDLDVQEDEENKEESTEDIEEILKHFSFNIDLPKDEFEGHLYLAAFVANR